MDVDDAADDHGHDDDDDARIIQVFSQDWRLQALFRFSLVSDSKCSKLQDVLRCSFSF